MYTVLTGGISTHPVSLRPPRASLSFSNHKKLWLQLERNPVELNRN